MRADLECTIRSLLASFGTTLRKLYLNLYRSFALAESASSAFDLIATNHDLLQIQVDLVNVLPL